MAQTIAALATAPGIGGIAIIRISGPEAHALLQAVFRARNPAFSGFIPWKLHRGTAHDGADQALDDVLAVYMPAPATFTGEDVAELHCHGGPLIVRTLLERLWQLGARPAERGEFTRRAFMNGRIDLSQAEAVAEMISAPSPEALRQAANRLDGLLGRRIEALRAELDDVRALMCLAVDFPDEEVEAPLDEPVLCARLQELMAQIQQLLQAFERSAAWREEVLVALTGPVNSGKSSLLNALLGRERALVSDIPGTTRDYLEERLVMDGLAVRLVDTAGLRELAPTGRDVLEAQGIERGLEQSRQADVVIVLVDGLKPDYELLCKQLAGFAAHKTIVVWNKVDMASPLPWWDEKPCTQSAYQLSLSAREGKGLEELSQAVRHIASSGHSYEPQADALAPNARQAEALRRSMHELEALLQDVQHQTPWDLCTVRLESAAQALAEVVGFSSPDDVLNSIFTRFCIGK